MILVQDETNQIRSEVATRQNICRKGGDHALPIVGQPVFAVVADDARLKDQILNDEVFVSFEDRLRRDVGQANDDFLGDNTISCAVLERFAEPGRFASGSRGGGGGVSRVLGAIRGRVLRPLRRAISSSSC